MTILISNREKLQKTDQKEKIKGYRQNADNRIKGRK